MRAGPMHAVRSSRNGSQTCNPSAVSALDRLRSALLLSQSFAQNLARTACRLQGCSHRDAYCIWAVKPRKTVKTDAYLQTLSPNIYAVGDVAGPYQFTHTAAHQAWCAAVNALLGRLKRLKADHSAVP